MKQSKNPAERNFKNKHEQESFTQKSLPAEKDRRLDSEVVSLKSNSHHSETGKDEEIKRKYATDEEISQAKKEIDKHIANHEAFLKKVLNQPMLTASDEIIMKSLDEEHSEIERKYGFDKL